MAARLYQSWPKAGFTSAVVGSLSEQFEGNIYYVPEVAGLGSG
jgi:hypothetical protein